LGRGIIVVVELNNGGISRVLFIAFLVLQFQINWSLDFDPIRTPPVKWIWRNQTIQAHHDVFGDLSG
jgi:hypothetical protein